MSSQPKVSVIVPVYNVADYIEKCAVSLFEQTLSDMEIIFVDDCSPDKSVEIIQRTLKKYPRRKKFTHIVRMPYNSGQAAVRKRGMEEASGEYVIHCDGDDWVDTNLYKILYDKAKAEDADIVICDEVNETSGGPQFVRVRELPNDCREVLKDWYKNIIGLHLHNKLVRRSLYVDHNVQPWLGLNMWEDNGLMSRLFYYGRRLAQVHDVYYHYNRMNVGAMTAGYGERQVNQMIHVAERITRFFENKQDKEMFRNTIMAFQFLARINLITDSYDNLRRYRTTFAGSEWIMQTLDEKAFSRKGLVRYRMVKWHLAWLFVLMFKIKNLIR